MAAHPHGVTTAAGRYFLAIAILACGVTPAAADVTVLRLAPLEAPSLDPALARAMGPMLAAALESGKGYQLLLPSSGADGSSDTSAAWELRLEVSGKGPWKLSARAVPTQRAKGASRVSTRRYPLSGLEQLPRAIDDLAAELHTRLIESDPARRGAAAPVGLETALTASSAARRKWLEGLDALRAGDPAVARKAFEEALAADPDFVVARAELYYLIASGDSREPAADAAPPRALAGGRTLSPLSRDLARAVDLMVKGEPARAYQVGELLYRELPSLRWGRVLRGLALAGMNRRGETAGDWEVAAAADPDDPRAWRWLGLARLASGDLAGAAVALRRFRQAWPDRLDAWALEAEAQARSRDLPGARETLEGLRRHLRERGLHPATDATNPALMLGCLDLLAGRFGDAMDRFEEALEEAKGAGGAIPTDVLYLAVVEMKRERITAADPLARSREIEAAEAALSAYESSLTPKAREENPWLAPWLRGLIKVRAGDTISGWRAVEELKKLSGVAGYSDYWEAYLSGGTLLKEGDIPSAVEQFQRAAASSSSVYDRIVVGQLRSRMKQYEEARRIFTEAEQRLARYDASAPDAELVLTSPRLAAILPVFHYSWAGLGYFTGNVEESRRHYSRMLKFYTRPDEGLMPLVREALDKGARPE